MTDRGVVGLGVMGWANRLVTRLMPLVVGLLVFALSFLTPQRNPFSTAAGTAVSTTAGAPGEVADPGSGVSWTLVACFALVAGVTAALGNRWRWPLFAVAVGGWLILTMWAAGMAASYYAAVKLRRRRDSGLFLVAALLLVFVPYVWAGSRAGSSVDIAVLLTVISVMIFVVLPYVAGLWVKARREVLVGLRDRAARLELEQVVRAEQARTEERERIAREMHDVLAHRVSLMVLHAGALEVNASDDQVAEEAALIRTTGRDALTELRQVLGVLRGGHDRLTANTASSGVTPGVDTDALAPQPVLADVDRLLERARSAGLPIVRRDEGVPCDLPVTAERAAYRVIQEALTNVAKHAAGAGTAVTLRWSPAALDLVVASGPPTRAVPAVVGSGYGLVGLRERVELLRGQFEARPRLDGGFVVRAVIPTGAVEADR